MIDTSYKSFRPRKIAARSQITKMIGTLRVIRLIRDLLKFLIEKDILGRYFHPETQVIEGPGDWRHESAEILYDIIRSKMHPVQEHDEYFGIRRDYLHDIGNAALRYDIGKMFVSKKIVLKKEKLDKSDREEVHKHTLYGARHVMRMEDMPQVSAIVALQYHLRFDGQDYPGTGLLPNRQHIYSHIIAKSDAYDAMRAKRRYKKDPEMAEILSLIRAVRGTPYNPGLANNFIAHLSSVLGYRAYEIL
jgi:HD-GYP domain-containing protein (c-di-GMP phosphodiesterase class II)